MPRDLLTAEKLIDRAPLIGAVIATMAAAATVFFLFGLGLGCGYPVLSDCDVSDFARLSVVWLAPIILLAVISVLGQLAVGNEWWLLLIGGSSLVIALVMILVHPERVPQSSSASFVASLLPPVTLLLLVLLLGLAFRRSTATQHGLIAGFGCAALIPWLPFSLGVWQGIAVRTASKPTIAVHISGAATPLQGIGIVQLSDELIVRELPSDRIYAIPQSRIELVEQLP